MMSEYKEYSRDSFTRFGDDLCEEILQYLSISDCLRCECVSKQFKRNVFQRQYKLNLSTEEKDHKILSNRLIYIELFYKCCDYRFEYICI